MVLSGVEKGVRLGHEMQIDASANLDSASQFRTIKLYGIQHKEQRIPLYRRSRQGRS